MTESPKPIKPGLTPQQRVNWRPPLPFVRTVRRGLTVACPVCGKRRLFSWKMKMVDRCPRCDLEFERAPGHSLGAIAINTILSFFVLAVVLTTSLIVAHPEFDRSNLLLVNMSTALIAPIAFFPMSKTLWTAMDLLARPLEPGEVHAQYMPPDPRSSGSGSNTKN